MFNLVVHGVCVGKVPAVLSQHLWEHDVPLVSKENISELFLLGYQPPEDAVISVANHKKAEQSVGDMDVKDKVQWIFLPHNQYIDTCVF